MKKILGILVIAFLAYACTLVVADITNASSSTDNIQQLSANK
ncbi:hypothetical protein [Seonamhaeicola maritimus]|nr:hypothetical protein [Seonamhaeicola maritimus]